MPTPVAPPPMTTMSQGPSWLIEPGDHVGPAHVSLPSAIQPFDRLERLVPFGAARGGVRGGR